jgi:hypothetical protein
MEIKTTFNHYIGHQKDFRLKWLEYFSMSENYNSSHFVDELTPLYGTSEYLTLTINEKERFHREYIKLIAEALVFFEQILEYGAWKLIKKNLINDPLLKSALNQFAKEELFHSQGFRHFLSIHKDFEWDKNKIYADSKVMRKVICTIINWSPAAVFLPGAKLEAFTLSYYKMIKKHYPNSKDNSWVHLNYIHQLDEAFHLPLEFELHDSMIDKLGPFKTIFGSILFVITMQIALVIGSYKVISYSFPEYSFLKKLSWMIKMAKWAVRTTPAYQEARQITKKQFLSKKPKWGKAMSFIYW